MIAIRQSACILVGLAACGQIAPQPLDAGPPETFAHQFGRVVCDNLKDCCAAENLSFDRASCIAVVAGQAQADIVSARAPDLPFHPDVGEQCLKLATERARTCDLTQLLANDLGTPALVWAGCFGLYSAGAPFGAKCEHWGDCASGRCASRCARIVPQVGDACRTSFDCQSFDRSVATSLHCDDASKTCIAPAGGACQVTADCSGIDARRDAACCSRSTPGYCQQPASIGSGCNCGCQGVCENNVCLAPPARGDPCTKYGWCGAGDLCDASWHCASHLYLYCGAP